MEKAEATATAASQRVLSLENTVKQLQSSNESFKRALSEKSSEFSALKTNYDSKHAEVRDTVARVEQLSKQLDDARVSFRIMKEKCELTADKLNTANEELKRKAASLPSRRTEEAWKTQEELMRQMRTRLKCSVCSDRDKNTVIKTCGHIFCRYATICSQRRCSHQVCSLQPIASRFRFCMCRCCCLLLCCVESVWITT